MRNIIEIFKRDIKRIVTNWITVVVVTALVIIPSLYSLINIEASWDPYSNTSGIKVAVINEDKGTVFKDHDINIGNELVDKLKDNDKLGWVFVDKENAKEGLIMEKYYATIEIPEDFSEDVTTLAKKNIVKPQLIYTVNEKKNVIASKITDSGVKSVQNELDKNITKTISGIVFRLCDEIGVDIENNRSELRNIMDSVYKLDDNMPELEKVLDEAINGTISASELLNKTNEILPTISDTIDGTSEFLNSTQSFLDETQNNLQKDSPMIKDDLVKSENMLDTAGVELGNIDDKILPETEKKTLLQARDTANATKVSVEDAKSRLKKIKKAIDKISEIQIPSPSIDQSIQGSEQIAKIQESIDKQVDALKNAQDALKEESKTISKIIDRLDTVDDNLDKLLNRINGDLDKLNNGEKLLDTQNLTDTRKVLDDAHTLISNITDSYDSEITPTVDKGFDSMREILDNGLNLSAQGKKTLPEVQEMVDTFKNTSDLSNDELNKLKDKFPGIKDNVHELAVRLKKIDNKEDIDELLDMITNNWDNQSDFLSSPVEVEDNRMFPWPNYGSTVTPFYTVLCLWIGGYVLSVLIGTESEPLEEGKELKNYEKYFGRLTLFIFIAIGQAIVASSGALLLLHSYAVHPVMFVLYSVFISIVFNCIIYTAVSLFGYGGIVMGVVLLVLQVAGTSGNFPIEVNPVGFQELFPFLPFTYAISGVRQILAGIVYSILLRDSVILCIFMIGSITIGVLFKEKVNTKRSDIVKMLKESSIMNG
ncbi:MULTISPECIES: YhgE/Pip domain-containing protein [unclassified Clostridium]|uniref:YhgE/Pip domain-containing protein n=1 Tax=unclassified Clostridium TaxID=2614128 RepID=UPI000298384D|nr:MULTISPECIES: YhgE/Pip domain-containing protein [unclassified Clostridium]EKQ50221.1 MAG: YhgE/Pip-like protein [Clostridium sp. Maddingley MBC34-26]